jgi:hypothetical protein
MWKKTIAAIVTGVLAVALWAAPMAGADTTSTVAYTPSTPSTAAYTSSAAHNALSAVADALSTMARKQ